MGYHHNPIEPSDWTHGNGDEFEDAAPMCPQKTCESHDVERLDDDGDSLEWYRCSACGWEGSEPAWIYLPSYEPEPDMNDFI